ncbi:MAG: hypothetical protein EB035_05630, partial [Actinobacteria bacterium]|nr:hypothetical protein [Actinomycetota bacterium]
MKKFGRALSKYFVNAHRRVKLSESRRVSTQLSPSSNSSLIAQSASELMPLARKIRDQAFGSRITFSPKVFIPLTMLCRDKCGYCTFAQPPARLSTFERLLM